MKNNGLFCVNVCVLYFDDYFLGVFELFPAKKVGESKCVRV